MHPRVEKALKHWKVIAGIASGVAAIAAVIVLPVKTVAWAEGLIDNKVLQSEIRQEAREEVIHGSLKAAHDFDFYTVRLEEAEENLIDYEQQIAEGVALTPTQTRRMRTLEKDIRNYEEGRERALATLKNPVGQKEEYVGEKDSESDD